MPGDEVAEELPRELDPSNSGAFLVVEKNKLSVRYTGRLSATASSIWHDIDRIIKQRGACVRAQRLALPQLDGVLRPACALPVVGTVSEQVEQGLPQAPGSTTTTWAASRPTARCRAGGGCTTSRSRSGMRATAAASPSALRRPTSRRGGSPGDQCALLFDV